MRLSEEIKLEKNKKHTIEVVIDRIVVKEGVQARLADSLETALNLADGKVLLMSSDQEELLFSRTPCLSTLWFSIKSLNRVCFPLTVHLVPARAVMA